MYSPIILRYVTLVLLLLATIQSYEQTKKFKKIQNIIDQATKKHLVGVAVYIKLDGHQEWIAVSGFQELESKTKLVPENILQLVVSVKCTMLWQF